jgi:hypothetical protein
MKSIHLRAALALAILLGALVLFVRTRPASNPDTISEPLGKFDPETRSLIARAERRSSIRRDVVFGDSSTVAQDGILRYGYR